MREFRGITKIRDAPDWRLPYQSGDPSRLFSHQPPNFAFLMIQPNCKRS